MGAARPVNRSSIILGELLELVPVVEFEPGDYRAPDRAGLAHDDPGYWAESLADAGIRGLEPIRPGGWLVETAKLVEPHVLRALVERSAASVGERPGEEDLEESVSPLSGGFALRSAGEFLIEPRCCGDLSNLQEWEDAVTNATSEERMLWIGHPWLTVQLVDGVLRLKEATEYPSARELREFRVSPAAILAAVEAAELERLAFRDRLRAVISGLQWGTLAPKLSGRLAGLAP